MEQPHDFLAAVLQRSAPGLAAYAAGDLLEAEPEAASDFAVDAFSVWRNWLATRLDELAAAAVARRPALFTAQVRWAKAALAARGVQPEHFRRGLRCLRGVLESELPEQVRPVAIEYLDTALERFDDEPAQDGRLTADSPDGRLAASYLLALLEGNRDRAEGMILDAARNGRTVPGLVLGVLAPAQEEVGRMWLAGEVNVAEEHFATATTKAVMAELSQLNHRRPTHGKTVLAAAVAGNHHDLGLHMVSGLFETHGWRSIQLGADVPISDLVQSVESFQVDLLLLSAALSTQLPTLKDTIEAVRGGGSQGAKVKILVGGRAFEAAGDVAPELGADAYAADAAEAVTIGRRLVGLPNPDDR